jgi:hypothetical protein
MNAILSSFSSMLNRPIGAEDILLTAPFFFSASEHAATCNLPLPLKNNWNLDYLNASFSNIS